VSTSWMKAQGDLLCRSECIKMKDQTEFRCKTDQGLSKLCSSSYPLDMHSQKIPYTNIAIGKVRFRYGQGLLR